MTPRTEGARAARAILLGIALLAAPCGARPLRAGAMEDLFEKGNAAFEGGRFDAAATSYEKILDSGLKDPRVMYNLGNAYFKLGRLGDAILQYERALRLSPGDRETRENLALALGQIRDRVTEPELQYPIRVVRETIERVPPDPLAIVFLLLYTAGALLVGGFLVSRSWVRRRLLGYGALFMGLLAATSGAALLYKVRAASLDVAIVMEDKVDVRSGPGEENTILFTVHEGTRMELRNRLEPWMQVSLPNGLSGWVPSSAVERV
jgi:tetratricopeptide (TPR) repeat protein